MYIENNLSEPIDLETIAGNVSYSFYHFSRLFKSHRGISVMDYVKQRKLIKASNDILSGAKIIDVAIYNGYESHSGFTTAFKNEFGFSPSLLRAFRLQLECIKGGNAMKQTDIHATKEELYEILTQVIKEKKLGYSFDRIEKAEETLKLFMPICNKIGNNKLKSELNDLALKYMQ